MVVKNSDKLIGMLSGWLKLFTMTPSRAQVTEYGLLHTVLLLLLSCVGAHSFLGILL